MYRNDCTKPLETFMSFSDNTNYNVYNVSPKDYRENSLTYLSTKFKSVTVLKFIKFYESTMYLSNISDVQCIFQMFHIPD